MAEKRPKFTIVGEHEHTELVRDFFIVEKKFELVADPKDADFVLASSVVHPPTNMQQALEEQVWLKKPAFVLSSDDLYTGRDVVGLTMEKAPMAETSMTIIHPTDHQANPVARMLAGESMWLRRKQQTMVLRCFNVYGPHITRGVVRVFFDNATCNVPLNVDAPGYQTRTFLYEEDFLDCVSRLVDNFLSGGVGIFNVGSDEEISIKRLAESVWSICSTAEPEIAESKSSMPHRFWKLPDLTRTKAVAGWRPKTSIRKGIWRMVHEDRRDF